MEQTPLDMTLAVAALTALGQLSRMAVFRLLAQDVTGGLPAGAIARLLDMRPNTLSGHLNILLHARLLTSTRHGRSIRYTVNAAGLRALMTWLLQDCCGGAPELCAPVLDRIACTCRG
jgi:ArsR family transcriptional regulator, arsenate/arsenite/antimonite-responsive transcriptional repressor